MTSQDQYSLYIDLALGLDRLDSSEDVSSAVTLQEMTQLNTHLICLILYLYCIWPSPGPQRIWVTAGPAERTRTLQHDYSTWAQCQSPIHHSNTCKQTYCDHTAVLRWIQLVIPGYFDIYIYTGPKTFCNTYQWPVT